MSIKSLIGDRSKLFFALVLASTMGLTACGNDSSDSSGGVFGDGSSGDTGSTGGTPPTVDPNAVVVSMGNGAGAGFVPGQLGINLATGANLTAGGSLTVDVSFVDQTNTPYTAQDVVVSFSSICAGVGDATFDNSTSQTVNGSTSVQYTATGCVGSETIIAQATANGQNLQATVSFTVAPDVASQIVTIQPNFDQLFVKGSGQNVDGEVEFQVLGATGSPMEGVVVDFELENPADPSSLFPGGMQLSPLSDTSDSNGVVRTTISSGYLPATVSVKATLQATPNISITASSIVVSGAKPDQEPFSLAAASLNPAVLQGPVDSQGNAAQTLGITNSYTVWAGTLKGNEVIPGVPVLFEPENGIISPLEGCTFNNSTSCSVTLTYTGNVPKPSFANQLISDDISIKPVTCVVNGNNDSDGIVDTTPIAEECRGARATLLAYMGGNETFVDTNANGTFDTGIDIFDTSGCLTGSEVDPDRKNCHDMAEAYLDENENGVYDIGESYIDVDNNNAWSPADGVYNGQYCDIARNADCADGRSSAVTVRDEHLTVMSCNEPYLVNGHLPGMQTNSFALQSVGFWLADCNGNAMPAGTTVSLVETGESQGCLKITQPSISVGNETEPKRGSFAFSESAGCDDTLKGIWSSSVDIIVSSAGKTTTIGTTVTAGTPTPPTNIRIGSGSGAGFTDGSLALGIGAANLSFNGSTTVSAALVNDDAPTNSPYTTPVSITFSSSCVAGGQGSFSATTVTTDASGVAVTTFNAEGCTGSDTITASATVDGSPVSATATFTIDQDLADKISTFGDPEFDQLYIAGSGQRESGTISFQVLGQTGAPVEGVQVDFQLVNAQDPADPAALTEGGMALVPTSSFTDSEGKVSTTIVSGYLPATVTVKATEQVNFSTVTSSQVVISGAKPDQTRFTLTTNNEPPNKAVISGSVNELGQVGGFFPGVSTTLRVDAGTLQGQEPIPGVPVLFRTETGVVSPVSGCTFNGSPSCSVSILFTDDIPQPTYANQLLSDNPAVKPITCVVNGNNGNGDQTDDDATVDATAIAEECRGGRATVLAYMSGNETFEDLNANGTFDDLVDNFDVSDCGAGTAVDPDRADCFDLPEAYLDTNENGQHDTGEYYIDIDQSNSWSAADGVYNGQYCDDQRNPSCADGRPSAVTVRAEQVLALSSTTPYTTPGGWFAGMQGTVLSTAATTYVWMADANGNALPEGTTLTVEDVSQSECLLIIGPFNAQMRSTTEPQLASVSFGETPACTTPGAWSASVVFTIGEYQLPATVTP